MTAADLITAARDAAEALRVDDGENSPMAALLTRMADAIDAERSTIDFALTALPGRVRISVIASGREHLERDMDPTRCRMLGEAMIAKSAEATIATGGER